MSAVKESLIESAAEELDFYRQESVPFGIPYIPLEHQSVRNSQLVLQEVGKRFPDFLAQAVPYQNILTFRQWRNRGYRVKKGEKSIRITVMKDIPDEDDPKQTRKIRRTACLFALPQVERE
jgi:N-terminal domain of anti-restriction factor ArdC